MNVRLDGETEKQMGGQRDRDTVSAKLCRRKANIKRQDYYQAGVFRKWKTFLYP